MDRKECHVAEKDIQGTEYCQYPNTRHWPKEHNCSQYDRSTKKILLYYIHLRSSFVATKPPDQLIMCTSGKGNLIYSLLHDIKKMLILVYRNTSIVKVFFFCTNGTDHSTYDI